MRVLSLALAGLAVTATGCADEIVFQCTDDWQCLGADGAEGICQDVGACSYSDPECPSQQRFGPHAATDLAGYCVPALPSLASGTATETTGSPAGDSPGVPGDSTGPGLEPCPLQSMTLDAILAACRSNSGHDPFVCMEAAGPQLIMIDTESSQLDGATVISYVSFVAPQPRTRIESAQLYMWTPDDGSDAAGELWRTEPFNGDSLRDASPLLIDNEPVAVDPGAVDPDTRVQYDLVPEMVEGQTTFHFAIVPMSSDGLRFIAREVEQRTPQLVIEYCEEP